MQLDCGYDRRWPLCQPDAFQKFAQQKVREDSRVPRVVTFSTEPGHVLDKEGKVVQTRIRPGARIRVYYMNTAASRAVDHVVLVD